MKRLITLCAMLTAMSAMLLAVPAKRGPIRVVMENGDTATVHLHGDEFEHRMTDSEGRLLAMGADERYHIMTGDEIAAMEAAAPARESLRAAARKSIGTSLNLAPRGLVVLVNFTDKQFRTSYDEMNDMINGSNYTRNYKSGDVTYTSSGSARRYFIDQSWGQYRPTFDVVGPYNLKNGYAYYGADGTYRNDMKVDEMIIEACQLADSAGVDFTLYDNDHDGTIDFVYVIYAWYGQADGGNDNTVWPHTSWIRDAFGKYVRLDGKYLNSYACGNELEGGTRNHTGIGTFCHEFSHVLGLPDLYNTQSNTTTKLQGAWDLMDYGNYNNNQNTPAGYTAYERFYMGWITPIQISGNADVTLMPLNTGRSAGLIAASTHNMNGLSPSPSTFYLIENRLQTGWDEHIPGSGMMLTKIQYSSNKWQSNTVNNYSTLGVDIIEADGITGTVTDGVNDCYLGKAGDLFPEGATEYTQISNHSITNIGWSENGNDIVFTLNNGGTPILIGTDYTGLNTPTDEKKIGKRIEHGRMVIVREGITYDITGRKL